MKSAESSFKNDARLLHLLAEIQTGIDNRGIELAKTVSAALGFLSSHAEDLAMIYKLEEAKIWNDFSDFSEVLCVTTRECLAEMSEQLKEVVEKVELYALEREMVGEVLGRLAGNKKVSVIQNIMEGTKK